MEHLDAIRLCLIGIIALVIILWNIPTKCEHPCVACERDRGERDRRRTREAHDAWHARPVAGCPYCRDK